MLFALLNCHIVCAFLTLETHCDTKYTNIKHIQFREHRWASCGPQKRTYVIKTDFTYCVVLQTQIVLTTTCRLYSTKAKNDKQRTKHVQHSPVY